VVSLSDERLYVIAAVEIRFGYECSANSTLEVI
jgi:hypothetical protein